MVIREFDEDRIKTVPVGLFFFPQNFRVGVTNLYLSKPPSY